jgi:hypothetical protein
VLKAVEKEKVYFDVMPKIEPESWYNYTKLSRIGINMGVTMGVAISGACDICEEEIGNLLHFVHLHEIHQAKANMSLSG